jgi:RND family efflux transporter MFP subunit
MADGGGSDRFRIGGRSVPQLGGAVGGLRAFGPVQNLLLGLALLLGGLGGYWAFTHFYEGANQAPQTGQPVRVVRTTIRNTVSATGTITATEQANLTFQVTGQITNILVKPGDRLQQGQPIAQLDDRAAQINRDQSKSSLASAQAKLDALLAGATPDVVAAAQQSVVSAQTNVTTSQATLTKSQNDLASLLTGATPTAIEQAQSGVDSATAAIQIAQASYDKLVSHSDLATRAETSAYATAKQNFEAAQSNFLSKLTPPYSTNVAQAQNNVKLARDALQTAQLRNLQVQSDPTSATSDKQAAQNGVTAARTAVDAAQGNLQLLLQGTDQTDIAAAQAQLDNSRVALQSAQTNYNNLVALSDLVTRPEYSALTQAQSQLETARANYANVVAPPQQTDVSSDQAAVQAAQAAIPSSQASYQAAQAKLAETIGPPLPTDITQAAETVRTSQLALQAAQLTLDNQTLRAPFTGTVISVPADVGQQIATTTTIANFANPNALEVDANVDETSVTQLKPGQTATVTLDALPGRTFNAVVAAVTPSGTTQQGVVVYPIVFTIDQAGQTVPAGASANITVTTALTPNVLAVPSRYVHRVGNNQVVDVLQSNKRISKVVTTGATNGQLTEIRSGLNAGDVAVPPPQTRQGATFGASGAP